MQNKAEKKEISPETMRAIYDEVRTPFKAGMALAPEPGEMLDSPVVFRHGDAWFMVFIRFDGKGYETHLAQSDDLRSWKRLGCIFRRGEKGQWDQAQSDAWPALVDTRWDGPNTLNPFNGRYWMMYLGGSSDGYETDPLSTGVAWAEAPSDLRRWTRLDCIFRRGEKGQWDQAQSDAWPALVDTRWDGPNTLNPFNGTGTSPSKTLSARAGGGS